MNLDKILIILIILLIPYLVYLVFSKFKSTKELNESYSEHYILERECNRMIFNIKYGKKFELNKEDQKVVDNYNNNKNDRRK